MGTISTQWKSDDKVGVFSTYRKKKKNIETITGLSSGNVLTREIINITSHPLLNDARHAVNHLPIAVHNAIKAIVVKRRVGIKHEKKKLKENRNIR